MQVKERKRRQQIRDQLIGARLENIGDTALRGFGMRQENTEQKEGFKCLAESCKKK